MKSLTGGDIGLQGIPRLGLLGWQLTSDQAYARLAGVALLGVVVVTRNLMDSRPGRGLRALSTSEVAAESCGIPVGRYKLAVFALSAAFAGLAGGIYAFYVGYVSPGSFPVLLSFEYVVMAVLGGLGTVSGGVIGAAAVTLLVQTLSKLATANGLPSSAPVVLSYAVFAVLLVIPVLFLPEGIVPAFAARLRRE
jgi:branched-chain amino acid transport system permease protein